MTTPARTRALRHWRKLRAKAAFAPKGEKRRLMAALRAFVTRTLSKEVK